MIKTHRIVEVEEDAHEQAPNKYKTLCGWNVSYSINFGFVRWVCDAGSVIPQMKLVADDEGLAPSCLKCWSKLKRRMPT